MRVGGGSSSRGEYWFYGALAAAFYGFFQFQDTFLSDRDAYFHIKIAALMLEQGIVRDLPWMAHAIHAERYVDFHFLYHCLLTPFVALLPDLITAAKLSTVVFAGLSVALFALLLGRNDIPARWFWVLCFLLASPVFTGRLMFGRGVTLFLGFVFLFLILLQARRFRLAGALCWIAVWTYPGFPLLGFLAVVWFGMERILKGDFVWPALLYPAAGIVAGLVIHPAFPAQFYGYSLELVVHALGPPGLEKIAEWLPPPLVLAAHAVAVPAVLALIGLLQRGRQWTVLSGTVLCAVAVAAVAFAASVKALEYLVPLLLLFAALRMGPTAQDPRRLREIGAAITIALLLVWCLPDLYARTREQFRRESPRAAFAVSDWLRARTEAGTLVLLAWDKFPLFFFRDHERRYLFGLNPVYSYGADRERYLQTRRFFAGERDSAGGPEQNFDATYAVLHRRRNAAAIGRFEARSVRPAFVSGDFIVFDLRND